MASHIDMELAPEIMAARIPYGVAGDRPIYYFAWPDLVSNTTGGQGNKRRIVVMTERKKNIVSVCWYSLDPLDSGGKVRTFNILKHMNYFKPWVIAPAVDGRATGIDTVVIKGRFTKHLCFNMEIFNYLWPDKRRWVMKKLREINPDFIQAEGIWSFPVIHSFASRFNKSSILVIHNIEHLVSEELYGRGLRSRFLKMIEGYCCRRADILVVCSENDRQNVLQEFNVSPSKIIIVPNGVERHELPGAEVKNEKPLLLFMGKLNYGPNMESVDFIKRLMPRLKGIKCLLIGEGIEPKKEENIEYLGRVAEVKKYLSEADICLAPLWAGSGTRLKMLEYLAMAKPVVATAKAVEGLGLTPGEDYFKAETLEEFEKAILEILGHRELWREGARRAREHVLERYAWDKIACDYEEKLRIFLENNV